MNVKFLLPLLLICGCVTSYNQREINIDVDSSKMIPKELALSYLKQNYSGHHHFSEFEVDQVKLRDLGSISYDELNIFLLEVMNNNQSAKRFSLALNHVKTKNGRVRIYFLLQGEQNREKIDKTLQALISLGLRPRNKNK